VLRISAFWGLVVAISRQVKERLGMGVIAATSSLRGVGVGEKGKGKSCILIWNGLLKV
jgi:hypothetical protein